MYLIVIFCIVVGSMADFSMFTTKSLYLAAFVAIVIVGSMFFQVLFSKLFKIDTDTTIIASTAFIFSAPFVPTVANALKNKEITFGDYNRHYRICHGEFPGNNTGVFFKVEIYDIFVAWFITNKKFNIE